MKSLSKMFGVIISSGLLLAFSGCVVMDLEDPAEEVPSLETSMDTWDETAEGVLDEAVGNEAEIDEAAAEPDEESGDDRYEVRDEPEEWPDPFSPDKPTGNGTGN